MHKLNYPLAINLVIAAIICGNLLLLVGFLGLDYDISGVESNVVFTLQNILTENSLLYANPEEVPFTITQYAPLYYMVSDFVMSLAGIEPEADFHIRTVGRLLSITTCFIVALLLFRIVKRQVQIESKLALVLCLGVISFPVPWYYLTRPDVFVALFYLLFLSVTLKYIDKPSILKAIIMGLLAFMAIAAKQSGIFLVGIGGLFFLYNRNFKGLLSAAFGFLVAAFAFSIIYASAGYEATYIIDNIVKGVDNGFGLRSFVDHTLLAFVNMYGAYIFGTVYIFIRIIKEDRYKDKKMQFLLGFAIFLFLFSTITATKKGSTANYYHDFLIATLLIWAFYLKSVRLQISTLWMHRAILFISLTILLVVVVHVKTYTFINFKKWSTSRVELQNINELLADELGPHYFYSNVRQVSLKFPGKVMLPQFDIAECCAYPRDIYNYDELCTLMYNGKLKFLIFDSEAPRNLFGCDVEHNFKPYRIFGRYHVYLNDNNYSKSGGL